MKRSLVPFLLALAIWPALLNAQVWCPPGATWHFGFNYGGTNGYTKYTYTGDTVIAGVSQQQIAFEVHEFSQNPSGYQEYSGGPIHTRLDDGVLYIYNTALDIWDTLIWYSAVPGDQWQVLQPDDFSCDCRYTVTDTGHTMVGGLSLRYVQTTVGGFECGTGSRRFLERIGSVHGTFLDECQIGDPDTTLRCYQDVDMSYSPPSAPACDLISGIDEARTKQAVAIYPNPGVDHLTVVVSKPSLADRMLVYDAMGQRALGVPLPNEQTGVDASSLTPGIYAYRVVDATGRMVNSGTWVKQ